MKIISILILLLIKSSQCINFVKTKVYNKTTVKGIHFTNNSISNSFQVSNYNPLSDCTKSCIFRDDCALAVLNFEQNICTMFNNQTTLMNTESSVESILISKQELVICLNGYYPDFQLQVCKMTKTNGQICNSSIECIQNVGLVCLNMVCQCSFNM